MKGFHKNSRRIENEVFILYMPDHKLVTASNLKKKKKKKEFFNFYDKKNLFKFLNLVTCGFYVFFLLRVFSSLEE
jgi:hypothetical protein